MTERAAARAQRASISSDFGFQNVAGQQFRHHGSAGAGAPRGGTRRERRSSCSARPEPARSFSRAAFTTPAIQLASSPSSRSTAPPFRRRCSSRSCSATSAAPSPTPASARAACSSWRARERFFSTRSTRCRSRCSPSCCACSSRAACGCLAAPRRWTSAAASSRRRNPLLEQAVATGAFREDLFYRLNVFTITLPPLRDRQEDIALIARQCLAESVNEHGRVKVLSPAALEALHTHRWPGNVRELRNVIERAAILSGDERTIQPEHLLIQRRTDAASRRFRRRDPHSANRQNAGRDGARGHSDRAAPHRRQPLRRGAHARHLASAPRAQDARRRATQRRRRPNERCRASRPPEAPTDVPRPGGVA